jgi:hypothetical protein
LSFWSLTTRFDPLIKKVENLVEAPRDLVESFAAFQAFVISTQLGASPWASVGLGALGLYKFYRGARTMGEIFGHDKPEAAADSNEAQPEAAADSNEAQPEEPEI